MPKCKIRDCEKLTQYIKTAQPYCPMHMARIRRHGYPELKKDAYQALEKLPHVFVDDFIRKNCQKMIDKEIVKSLRRAGYQGATEWTVKYRRRKLGIKKYLYGEMRKHKAWIRAQAIKRYGDSCELCGYRLAIDTHHIVPKQKGGPHEVDNLMVVCPNCHALITRGHFTINHRDDIPKIQREVANVLEAAYPNFG